MDFEFVIPVSRDDLLNKTGVNQFVVDEILTLREVTGAIQGMLYITVINSFNQQLVSCLWLLNYEK
jgi:hypothetical protein